MLAERVLMKGNEAIAEAAIRAGCRHYFGYPITPQTEIAAYMSRQMPKVGGVFLQAESEIAAINMVLGAAAAGVRAMTSSSSPGISLKSEGVSYIAGSDLPCVIVDCMRGGPGLGGIQPSQSDYWQATKAYGHGDFQLLVFAPNSVQEMVTAVFDAFENADRFRMPAMVLADGLLGQMMEPVVFPDRETVTYEKPWAVDGRHGKRSHNIVNSLYLSPKELEDTNVARFARYEEVKRLLPKAETYLTEDADVVVAAFGATSRIVKSAVNSARALGIKAGMVRPYTLWPFPAEQIREGCEHAHDVLVVEMNMGQMVDDVKLALNCAKPVSFFGHTGGIIPSPAEVLGQIKKLAGGEL